MYKTQKIIKTHKVIQQVSEIVDKTKVSRWYEISSLGITLVVFNSRVSYWPVQNSPNMVGEFNPTTNLSENIN